MTVCGGWSLVRETDRTREAITMFCRSWACADCMPYRLASLKRLARSGQPSTFLTLTVNPLRGQSPENRAQELTDALKIMMKRARRKWTKAPIEYLAVFEETKQGEPHLHLLMRAPFVPQKWLSEQMNELIEAPIVDIRHVHAAAGAARYVAKYVAKGPKGFGSLKRYWCTPKYDLDETRKAEKKARGKSGWMICKDDLETIWQDWARAGFAIDLEEENCVLAGRTEQDVDRLRGHRNLEKKQRHRA